jgi:hypothetical protein
VNSVLPLPLEGAAIKILGIFSIVLGVSVDTSIDTSFITSLMFTSG